MSSRFKRLRMFRKREDGNATIEFVFLFPLFMSIFLMGFESGYYMVRTVLLERAVDISVREIRLGNGRVPGYDRVIAQICESAVIIPNCSDTIHVYMEEIDITPGAVAAVVGEPRCLNRFDEDGPQFGSDDYNVGQINTMMMVQVCAAVSPFFPTTGIGLGLQDDQLGGNYAIVATSAFVTEPGTRAQAAPWDPDGDDGSGDGSGDGSADGTTDPSNT